MTWGLPGYGTCTGLRPVRRLGVQQFGDGEVAIDHQTDSVAIRRLGHGIGRDVAAGAGAVVHDHRLAQGLGQGLGQRTRRQVRAGAAREAHQDTNGLGRPWRGRSMGLRPCELPRHDNARRSPAAQR